MLKPIQISATREELLRYVLVGGDPLNPIAPRDLQGHLVEWLKCYKEIKDERSRQIAQGLETLIRTLDALDRNLTDLTFCLPEGVTSAEDLVAKLFYSEPVSLAPSSQLRNLVMCLAHLAFSERIQVDQWVYKQSPDHCRY